MSTSAYPVRVDATLEDRLSRWLWLVKWFLAIPHYVVLAFLWLAFVVLSVVAFVAILVTGRYPRAIFDFNVGVLRWTWRVSYYAYDALGTDRYPPFTLQDRVDYPARLEVDYPEHLSRGLVLVKWWLLAIPHYLVVALFIGAGWYALADDPGAERNTGFGLIGLLVLIAAVVLLFTGRYPRPIFDLVLGLNRWVLRVAAYVALMTDTYPPFRLDMGGTDPATAALLSTTSTAGPATPTSLAPPPAATGGPTGPGPAGPRAPAPRSSWGAGRVTAVVLGALAALTALGLLVGGGVLRFADGALRDEDGYLTSSAVEVDSPGYAVTTETLRLDDGTGALLPERWLGTVKVEAAGHTGNGVFIGIATTADVDRYLDGVAASVLVDPTGDDGAPELRFTDGGSPSMAPQDATFWVASADGTGQQTLTWEPEAGDWTLVVMNGEGTTPVEADVALGATAPVLDDIALFLLAAGLTLGAVAALVLVLALRRRTPDDGSAR